MKLINFILVIVFFTIALTTFAGDVKSTVKFAENKNCVAWRARKTLYLFKHVEPVGMNCLVQSKVINNGDGDRFRLTVPINKFDSGEPSRDKEVFSILGGDHQPDIVFTSRAIDEPIIKNMLAGSTDVLGLLFINGKGFPVHFMVSAKKVEGGIAFTGDSTTKFSTLQISPIKVAFGLIASVDDYLELHFHLLSAQIEGFPANLNL